MINHRFPASDGHSRQRNAFPTHRNPKPSSTNVKLAFFVNMILFFCARVWSSNIEPCELRPASPVVDESRSDTNPIESQGPSLSQTLVIIGVSMWAWPRVHNTSALWLNTEPVLFLIWFFHTFMVKAVSPRLQALTVHLMSRVSNRQSPLDQLA